MAEALFYHKPVLLKEVLNYWLWKPGGFYIDATVGTGGHSQALLESDPKATLLGLDLDPDALGIARERLKKYGDRVELIHSNYADLFELMKSRRPSQADGILLDCGVSSLQLDRAERGFSFEKEGRLDMRMNPVGGETALEMIHRLPVEQLAKLIYIYGEEELARPIAAALKQSAEQNILNSTTVCAKIISQVVLAKRPWAAGKRIHPATKTFQALRISVNKELENLGLFLKGVSTSLVSGGRGLVISFHSLEDRLVKNTMRAWFKGCVCPADFPQCVCGKKPEFKTLTPKVIRPSKAEVESNPRSRSAKLRVAEKI